MVCRLGKFTRCTAASLDAFLAAKMVTTLFHSTRLETLAKQFNICAGSCCSGGGKLGRKLVKFELVVATRDAKTMAGSGGKKLGRK